MRSFFIRHQARSSIGHWIVAGLGAALAIGLVAWLADGTERLLLIASFGATCVLLFHAPNSPFSQPPNVIGGHLLSAGISLALRAVLPNQVWAMALAMGVVVAAMAALRLTHPPAGGHPILVFPSDPGLDYLLFPVLAGTAILVATATLFHRMTRTVYPLRGG